jgi:hypothetical protein
MYSRATPAPPTHQEVIDQLQSLKRKVGILSRKVKKREAMIEEIWEALKDMYTTSGEAKLPEGNEEEEEEEVVTATATSYWEDEGMDADQVSAYTALKEDFKRNCYNRLGYRPTTPEIRELAFDCGGSITM